MSLTIDIEIEMPVQNLDELFREHEIVDGLNLYRYVLGDPINNRDPLGLFGGPIYSPPEGPLAPGSPYQTCGNCVAPLVACLYSAIVARASGELAVDWVTFFGERICDVVHVQYGLSDGNACRAEYGAVEKSVKDYLLKQFDQAVIGCWQQYEDCQVK